MKYCTHCGNELVDAAVMCPKCGMAASGNPATQAVDDTPSTGLAVLSFFFPIVGLILFLVWKDTKPRKAKSVGKAALIGFIVGMVLNVIAWILGAIAGAAIGSSMYYYY